MRLRTEIGSAASESETAFEIALKKPNRALVRIRYPSAGEWLRVSDGTRTWRYRSITGQLNENEASPSDLSMVKGTILADYQRIGESVKKAAAVGTETIHIGGTDVPCVIVEVECDRTAPLEGTELLPSRYWIDQSHSIVLREISAARSKSGSTESRNTKTITFELVEVNEPLDDRLFSIDSAALARK